MMNTPEFARLIAISFPPPPYSCPPYLTSKLYVDGYPTTMSDTTDWSSQVLSRIDKQCNYGDYSIKVIEGPQSIPIVGRTKNYPNGHYSRNRSLFGCMSGFAGLPPCLALGFYLCEVSKPQDPGFTTQRIYLCTCCTELCGICGEEQIVVCEADTIKVMTVDGHPLTLRQGSLTMVKTVVEEGAFGYKIRDLGDRIKKDIERMCRRCGRRRLYFHFYL